MINPQQTQPIQQTTQNIPPQAAFQSASLYVGDLHPEVTEGVLFELFNRVGPVASIRVCRDAITRRSLGYAYVNFHNVQDAERSLDTMNFTDIKGRPCRIMWSQRDPSLRKSGVGNVFVKNLPANVDNKGLFDTFSVFGNILSCKVATDENGVSKGYGYVHYETAEAAQDAISKFNGNFIDEFEVSVGPFVRKQERSATVNWTNLYVKQFPLSWDEAKLTEIFGAYGTISGVFLTKDADGRSKGFGFINFAEHEAAEKALSELNGKSFPADPPVADPATPADAPAPSATIELYVSRAQKRAERQRDIKTRLDALKEDRVSKFQGLNLYVKNIDDAVTDELFRETFAKFGTVTSARIMRESDGVSKGFGFVCYSTAEEAGRAATELNNKLLRSKPIAVTFHQRRDVRRAQLAATYAPRTGNARYPGANVPLPYLPMYIPQTGAQGAYPPQGQPRPFFQGGQAAQYPPRGAPNPRGIPFNGGRGAPQTNYYPTQGTAQAPGGAPGAPGGPQGQPLQNGNQPLGQPGVGGPLPTGGLQRVPQGIPTTNVPRGIPQQVQGARGPYVGIPPQGYQQGGILLGPNGLPVQQQPQQRGGLPINTGVKFNANARNQGGVLGVQNGMPVMIGGPQSGLIMGPQPVAPQQLNDPLDDQMLAAADPLMQKNMIGEKLYPLIYVSQPAQAGKITGMLLEMDNAELLNLIESPEALAGKIEEALLVLKNHQAPQPQE